MKKSNTLTRNSSRQVDINKSYLPDRFGTSSNKLKKLSALLMCLILSVCTLCACGDPSDFSDGEKLSKGYTRSTEPTLNYNYNDGATTSPMSYNNYAGSITNFELRLFRNYFAQKEDKTASSVFNPSGVALQLSLLLNGASGDTKDELSLALGSDLTVENINQCSSYFKSRMEAVSKNGNGEVDELSGKKKEEGKSEYVKLGTNMYFNDISDVKTSFLQTNASYYGGDVFRFMFSDENAVSKVNKSLSDFSPKNPFEHFDENDSLFTVTASDISDLWLDSYTKSDIKEGSFNSGNGKKTVSYMTSNESLIKTENAQGVLKYTEKNPLKLMLVMPNKGTSLEDYVADFNYLEFSNLLDSIDITKKVTAEIPQFSISAEQKPLALSDIITKSGLYSLFTENASFKNMTHTDNFTLNEMYQLTPAFGINASGINSSADIAESRVKELKKTAKTIKFDRPFIFILIDNESNIPLYIGTADNI